MNYINLMELQCRVVKARIYRGCPDDTVMYLTICAATEMNGLLEIMRKLMCEPTTGIAAFDESLPDTRERVEHLLFDYC